MPSPLTGQLGLPGSQLGFLQLGGPAYAQRFTRQRPAQEKPLIGHVYASDGVTFQRTIGPFVGRPTLHWVSNGSYDRVTLDLPVQQGGSAYGSSTYGTGIYGGLTLGQIVKLTEQDGDGTTLYTGVLESKPDTTDPTQPRHQLQLAPIAYELDDTVVELVYSAPTDVAQMVRDAVDATAHLTCDQISVPASTGILFPSPGGGAIDFTNRFAKEVLDVARSMAGPSWYWFVGGDGRVWFQAMGSSAVYTLRRGVDYEKRVGAGLGGSIADLRNDILVVGGVPPGGSAPVSARYRSGSFGLSRGLQQPISLPSITDQPTLAAVAASVGAVLDRPWVRVQIKVNGNFGQPPNQPLALGTRISMEQPGGAMVRFWEPNVSPLAESGTGTGTYTGPFIVQDLADDGSGQVIAIGDVPVTDARDIQYLGEAGLKRALAHTLLYTPAALNVLGVVTDGGLATAPNPPAGSPSPRRYVVDQTSIRSYDGTGANYGAPSGQPGVSVEITPDGRIFIGGQAADIDIADSNGVLRVEMGNIPARGGSPAQEGIRVNRADGVTIFDTNGLMLVESAIGSSVSQPWSPTTLNGTTTPTGITGLNGEVLITSCSFTLTRAGTVKLEGSCSAVGWVTSGINPLSTPIYVRVTGQANGASGAAGRSTTVGSTSFPTTAWAFQLISLPQGTYTANLIWNSVAGTTDRLDVYAYNLYVFLKGS